MRGAVVINNSSAENTLVLVPVCEQRKVQTVRAVTYDSVNFTGPANSQWAMVSFTGPTNAQ